MRTTLILCYLAFCQLIHGQSPLPVFGEYSQEEINLKECSFEKNAGAVILLDEAVSDHDEDYKLITHHRIGSRYSTNGKSNEETSGYVFIQKINLNTSAK